VSRDFDSTEVCKPTCSSFMTWVCLNVFCLPDDCPMVDIF
jgi:hypothetical protein